MNSNYPMLVVGFQLTHHDAHNYYGVPLERRVICEDEEQVKKAIEFFKFKGPKSAEILVYTPVKRIRRQDWVETDYV